MFKGNQSNNLIKVYHHVIWTARHKIYRSWLRSPLYQRFYYFHKLQRQIEESFSGVNRSQNSVRGLVAITCSTNYTEVLAIVIQENIELFDEWIVVTDPKDLNTLNLLKKYPKITTLLFDFTQNGNRFNKGGGIRMAQRRAYKSYPDHWYLILDSDICITSRDSFKSLDTLNDEAIYLCSDRRNFQKLSDFRRNTNFEQYSGDMRAGFLQLYRKKKFYIDWPNAGRSDIEFTRHFSTMRLFRNLSCAHLGEPENYDGKKGPRFLIDDSRDKIN